MLIVGDDLANTRIIGRLGGLGEWMNVSQARRMVRCCCQNPHLTSSVPQKSRVVGELGTAAIVALHCLWRFLWDGNGVQHHGARTIFLRVCPQATCFWVQIWTFFLSPVGNPPEFSTDRWSIFGLFVCPWKIRVFQGFPQAARARCQKTDFVACLSCCSSLVAPWSLIDHWSDELGPSITVQTNVNIECWTMILTTTASSSIAVRW